MVLVEANGRGHCAQDEGFPIGIAFWGGVKVDETGWGNATAGPSPCKDNADKLVRTHITSSRA